MPLPVPLLDDRSYQQLREELLNRLRSYTPEWTDRSPADPGVTLLELVAFATESLLFRFNQIPDATRLWLLNLVGVPLRPAAPARGLVAFNTTATAPLDINAGSQVRAGAIPFEIEQDVTVLPVCAVAAAKLSAPAPTDPDLVAAAEAAIDAYGLADDEEPVFYRTELLSADPTAPDATPLDLPSAIDRALWIAVIANEPENEAWLMGPDDLDGVVLNVGVVLDPVVSDMFHTEPSRDLTLAGGQVQWQISTVDETADGQPKYLPVEVLADTTGGLTRDGVVRLRLPAGRPEVGVPLLVEPGAAGAGALPPPLDDDRPVLCWLRAFPAPGAPELPRLRWIGLHAAEAMQAVTAARPEYLGTGTGQPDQRYRLAHRPVQVDALPVRVEVEFNGVWVPWAMVESLAASGPDDHHYVLDAEAAEVGFGNTLRGRAPQLGERIRILPYRYGGGPEGNVPAGAIDTADADAEVTNPLPMGGGTPAETLAEALDRIPGEFRRHDRAVTASDFAELAFATPGGEVGRAECLPRFHPPSRATEAAGVVTVVVWPRQDTRHPNAPRPERGLLRRICVHLDARRLVTTELYVVPPEYRRVAVSVGVAVRAGHSADAVRRWVELVLRRYLAPLPPYGPDGTGWPLGRRVHGPELEAAALQVEGVEYLHGLEVAGYDPQSQQWVPGTVTLQPWEVVEVAAVSVIGGPQIPPPGQHTPPPPTPGRPVPVPVRREEC